MERTLPSPDGLELRSRPQASARLNRKAVLAAIAALAIIFGVVIVNVSKGKSAKAAEAAAAARELAPALNEAKDLTKDIPDFVTEPPPKPVEVSAPPPPVDREPVKSTEDDARLADTAVAKFLNPQRSGVAPEFAAATVGSAGEGQSPAEGAGADDSPGVATGTNARNLTVAERTGGGLIRVADQGLVGETDLNHQSEKLAFLQKSQPSAYLNSQLKAPVSPFELKTGTVIPGTLISAINSDLPGEIIAQVAANVYDTATGKYLLIPQGSKLFGHYDSKVSFGQRRVLVSWQRLIYPNAYTLELGGMSGHDSGGLSGFADRVNNHYARIFGWALFTSVLSAGAQLSQPQQANSLVPSNGQVAAAAVGQQMAQLGEQLASRNIQVQPTIEIRKGYRLNVMVSRDIIFPGTYPP
jgi:type IV secretion system protein TrbI